MSFYSEVGQRVYTLRKMQNLTREELAEKTNLTSKFIYEVETGRKGFSAANLYAISRALSVKSDYILTGEEEDEQSINISKTLELFEAGDVQYLNNILKELYALINSRKNGMTVCVSNYLSGMYKGDKV